MSGPSTEPSPLTRMSRPLTATTRSAGMRSCACGDADRIKRRHEAAEQGRGRQDHRQRARQEDQGNGGARKAEAERGQYDAPVKAVRKPADRDLERKSAEHGHQHEQRDRLACDALALHPRRNERVERAADEPARPRSRRPQRARRARAGHRAVSRRAVRPGRLGPGRAHHDQRHGEQGDDRIEWRRRLDLGPADQELSHREGQEGADHVDRENPSAL